MNIPKHVAIVMDGNGRWAKNRFLPRTFGHREGAKTLKKILSHAGEIGVKYLSVYAFSTENWTRPEEEVSTLMKLFKNYLKNERKDLMKNNIRLKVSGRKEKISSELLDLIAEVEELTKDNDKVTLNICFNYGGRAEIIDAVNSALKDGKEKVSEEDFKTYLYNDFPDPDLLIRTSGELRLSNFLLWQLAYSEIYVTEVLWPDFDEKELDKAILAFNKRSRRFGGVVSEK